METDRKVTPEETRKLFDAAYSVSHPYYGDRESAELAAYLDKHPMGGAALDAGCGDGRQALHLLRRGFDVTAVDLSPVAIAKLETLAAKLPEPRGRLAARACDVREWAWPEGSFDLIVAATLLDHLPKQDIPRIAASLIGAAKPGGLLFIQVHTFEDPGCTHVGTVSETGSGVAHYYAANELLETFRQSVRFLSYQEWLEWDYKHGDPHQHGFATLLGRTFPKVP